MEAGGGGMNSLKLFVVMCFKVYFFEKDVHFYCLTIKLRTIFELNLNVY